MQDARRLSSHTSEELRIGLHHGHEARRHGRKQCSGEGRVTIAIITGRRRRGRRGRLITYHSVLARTVIHVAISPRPARIHRRCLRRASPIACLRRRCLKRTSRRSRRRSCSRPSSTSRTSKATLLHTPLTRKRLRRITRTSFLRPAQADNSRKRKKTHIW